MLWRKPVADLEDNTGIIPEQQKLGEPLRNFYPPIKVRKQSVEKAHNTTEFPKTKICTMNPI